MRIDNKNPQSLQRPLSERKTPLPGSTPAEAPAEAAPAVVRLVSDVSASSAGNAERLQQLRQQVAEGRYHVDLDQLASNIADDELSRHGSDR